MQLNNGENAINNFSGLQRFLVIFLKMLKIQRYWRLNGSIGSHIGASMQEVPLISNESNEVNQFFQKFVCLLAM